MLVSHIIVRITPAFWFHGSVAPFQSEVEGVLERSEHMPTDNTGLHPITMSKRPRRLVVEVEERGGNSGEDRVLSMFRSVFLFMRRSTCAGRLRGTLS